jgi:hypothetical protein
MEQKIRDLFTEEEWKVFAGDATSALAAVENLPVRMEESADEEE